MWGQQQKQRPFGKPSEAERTKQQVKIPDVNSVLADLAKEEAKEKAAVRAARTATVKVPPQGDSCWC